MQKHPKVVRVVNPNVAGNTPTPINPGQSDEWNWKAGYKERMSSLLRTGYKSDLTIVLGKKEFKVHRLVLETGSRVLNTRIDNCSSARLQLDDCDALPDIFEMFLKYLYTGESGAQMNHALRLLKLATQFEVSELRDQCAETLKGTITLSNVVELFNEAMLFAHKDLIRNTLGFICRNGQEVLLLDSFNQLRLEGLVEILQQDSLRVKGEIDVFNAVYRWGEAQLVKQKLPTDTQYLKKVLDKPLKYVRFPLMDSKDFGKIVAPKKLLDADDTISLLTSFLLPLSDRGSIHGTFPSSDRSYIVEEGKKVIVYRSGSSSGIVDWNGSGSNTETLLFLSSKEGSITDISFSEACFDPNNDMNVNPYSVNSEFVVDVKVVAMDPLNTPVNNSARRYPVSCDFKALPLVRVDAPASTRHAYYGIIITRLPTPVAFPKSTWITLQVTLQNNASRLYTTPQANQIRYASPYTNNFVDGSDPSITFQFDNSNGVTKTSGSGLIHQFSTVLTLA